MGEDRKSADLAKVQELVDLMIEKNLVEVEIVDGESKIHLRRPEPQAVGIPMAAAAAPVVAESPAATPVAAPESAKAAEGLVEIKSPIVGTFYSAPSPDSDPYVSVNSHVDPDTVVGIVEAMKVMNEIKAEMSGTITEILCQTGEAVEYGQALFRVRPD